MMFGFLVIKMCHFLDQQESNKLEVMQTLILHSTFLKHKAALDQFRKGLSILGLLREIERNPQKFEHFFVRHDENISPGFVKKLLKVPDTRLDAVNMLYEFIDTASKEDLSDFLLFTTGSMVNTGAFRPECIKVSVENTQGFFASTCSFELTIPACILTSEEFQLILKSVIKGNRFTTV